MARVFALASSSSLPCCGSDGPTAAATRTTDCRAIRRLTSVIGLAPRVRVETSLAALQPASSQWNCAEKHGNRQTHVHDDLSAELALTRLNARHTERESHRFIAVRRTIPGILPIRIAIGQSGRLHHGSTTIHGRASQPIGGLRVAADQGEQP
jgi:hypothetical protein